MTADKDLSARLKLHDDGATSGKWGQFNPRFMDEAKDAQMQDWDTSHGLSAVYEGKRKRIAEWKHAADHGGDDPPAAHAASNSIANSECCKLDPHEKVCV